ncbi:MAG TPA: hypothetical protein VHX86_18125 [Tepidisphaeraceae bacterium]|nr:hypothetical protein [Tepidisphaeraceae bacterium]
MSRLDHHILAVRNKLTLGIFLEAWAWTGLLLGVLVLVAVIGQRVLDRAIAHPAELFWIGAGATVLGAWIYCVVRRPSAELAAVKIDEVMGLKEKFSTALYARELSDPFAQAAVRDAEGAANRVSLNNRFPLKFPRQAITTAAVFLLAFLVAEFMPPLHLFARQPQQRNKESQTAAQGHHDDYVKQAMPTILAPAALPNASDKIRRAADDLNKAVHTDEGDELRNHRSVLSALQDYDKTMVEEMKTNEKFQTAMEEREQLSAISNAKDDSTPIGKAQNELKGGNLDAAVNDISKAVNQFDKTSAAEQQKMVNQAANLAQELSKAANDPKVGQRVAQQLMQMGATQPQAQRMSAAMQQAAQGNKQAQQQMQQMARQMAKQMNNGQGPTQQQQQQIQSMMAKAQAMVNSQVQAQALSSAAQQLSVAMAQAKSAQQQQQSSRGQQSRPGQGQGNQPGGGQGMAAAQQNMQQQLQQMQANAKDAQAMQAAASAAAQAAADAASGLSGSSSGDADGQSADSGNNGQNPNMSGRPGGNNAGWTPKAGKGGARMGIALAPATFKQEYDPSKENDQGKILASRYVKAGIDLGKSTAGLKDVAASAEKDAPDDIDQDHIPRDAQQAEKDYFSAMQDQSGQ